MKIISLLLDYESVINSTLLILSVNFYSSTNPGHRCLSLWILTGGSLFFRQKLLPPVKTKKWQPSKGCLYKKALCKPIDLLRFQPANQFLQLFSPQANMFGQCSNFFYRR
jgi:hypothetical protein